MAFSRMPSSFGTSILPVKVESIQGPDQLIEVLEDCRERNVVSECFRMDRVLLEVKVDYHPKNFAISRLDFSSLLGFMSFQFALCNLKDNEPKPL